MSVKFRQKIFGWPAIVNGLLTGGMLVQGGVQMSQASKQAQEAAEQNEQIMRQQKKDNEKLVNALNNVAKNAPEAGKQVSELVGKAKLFASPGFFTKIGKFGKVVVNAMGGKNSSGIGNVGKTFINMGTMGAIGGISAYGVDKIITKDARKIGMMPSKLEQRSYTLSRVGNYIGKGVKYLVSKDNLKSNIIWGTAFAALPAGGYLLSRNQYKKQLSNQQGDSNVKTEITSGKNNTSTPILSPKQKSYSVLRKITGTLASFGSFGKITDKSMQQFGKNLRKSKNTWAKGLGNWIKNNPNSSNLIGAGAGVGVIGGTMTGTENLVRKIAKKADKNAFAYENFQSQPIPQN